MLRTKGLITLVFVFFLFYGCDSKNSKDTHVITQVEKEQNQLELADFELSYEKEKIALLANIKEIPYDTLYLILRDYYLKSNDNNNDTIVNDAISFIQKKYGMPRQKVAGLIFSFKYEMLTQDKILEKEAERNTESKADLEPESPY